MRYGRDRAAAVAWAFALLAVALVTGAIALVLAQPVRGPAAVDPQGVLTVAFEVLAFAGAGALIVTRHPRHPIGWIYTASGLLIGLAVFSAAYSQMAQLLVLPFAQVADAVFGVTFFAGFLLPITLGLLLFPDGQLVSRRWRAAVLITIIGYVGIVGVNALAERPEYAALHTAAGFGALTLPAVILASVASLILRWRRAVGVERQQLKWVGGAALLLGLDLIAVILLAAFGAIPPSGGLTFALLTLGIALLPVAVGIAILRYRLYDIDVVIRGTIVYAVVTVALAATFFGGIVLLQGLLRPFTGGNELAVAGSTLASVALFQPLRARIQGAVDRRFYRARYDAGRTLDAFSGQLANEVDLDALRGDLLAVVGDTMQPVHVSLWLRGTGR